MFIYYILYAWINKVVYILLLYQWIVLLIKLSMILLLRKTGSGRSVHVAQVVCNWILNLYNQSVPPHQIHQCHCLNDEPTLPKTQSLSSIHTTYQPDANPYIHCKSLFSPTCFIPSTTYCHMSRYLSHNSLHLCDLLSWSSLFIVFSFSSPWLIIALQTSLLRSV